MKLFLYPLNPTPMLLKLVTSFMIWLVFYDIFSFLVMIYFWPMALTVLVYFKYLFVTLERTANGYTDAPVLSYEFFRPFEEIRPYQLLLVTLFVCSLSGKLWQLGLNYPGYALIIYFLCTLPAFAGMLGIRNGFYASLNPVKLFRFIYRTGPVYLLMLGLLATGCGLIYLLSQSRAGLFSAIFLSLYCVDLVFLSIGKVIYGKREALDYRPDVSPERAAERLAELLIQRRKHNLDRVFKERRREGALAVLLAHIDAEEDRLAAHAWYHKEMMQWGQKQLAVRHGQFYVRRLREAGKHIIADLIQQECRAVDPDAVVE
jgi:hypothetical protein